MLDWLTKELDYGSKLTWQELLIHMLAALAFGLLVSLIYNNSRPKEDISPSFPGTLVLMTVLIAMVTQVIGDSVARAFSLVGALSIVRFRTVVRDAQDTAYVIFAVIVGMAVGGGHLKVSVVGLGVVALASLIIKPRKAALPAGQAATPGLTLTVRLGSTLDPEKLVAPYLEKLLSSYAVVSVATARQGTAIELCYDIYPKPGVKPADIVRELNGIDGIQTVDIKMTEEDDD